MRLLAKEDFGALKEAAGDPDVWTWFPVELTTDAVLQKWIETMLDDYRKNSRIPLTITDRIAKRIIGSSSFMHIAEADLCLEIGTTWIAKEYHGTGINYHMKYAMLHHAFEVWGFERVEFRTDVLNVRSRRAIEKIGATYEGMFRNHRFNKYGGRRDSVIYSILKEEWPGIADSVFREVNGSVQ